MQEPNGIFIHDHKSMIVSGLQSSHALKTLKTTVAVGAHYARTYWS
jgi:hypothetical protein